MREKTKATSLADNVVAQAAVVVTLIAAVVYASGAVQFFIRLWLLQLPAEAVLGQLPHDLLITVGLPQVVLPAFVLGVVLSRMLPGSVAFKSAKVPVSLPIGIDGPVKERTWHQRLAVAPIVILTVAGSRRRLGRVKARWNRTATPSEWSALQQMVATC